MPPSLAGQVCVITGATGRIGKACVEEFVRAGAEVVAVDVVKGSIDGVKEDDFVICNQADILSIAALETFLVSKYGRIDVLVNNGALGGERASFHDKTTQEYDDVMGVNVKGPFLLSQLAIRLHLKTRESWRSLSIVNIASIAGHRGFTQAAIYSTSKHALIGLTKNVAVEYGSQGVRCNTVSPGMMEVPNIQGFTQDHIDALTSKVPVQRGGKPSEVASVVCFLASDEASYINGTDILVDGGLLAQ